MAVLHEAEQLRGTLSPLRRRLLEELAEPGSATGLAVRLGETRQRVNYHLRELEKSGLVELVEVRQRRGGHERIVRATARTVVVAPVVVSPERDTDPAVRQDAFAAETLLAATARAFNTVAGQRSRAAAAGKRLVTFTVETDVTFGRPSDIEEFVGRLAESVARLSAEYAERAASRRSRRFRLTIAGHPAPAPEGD